MKSLLAFILLFVGASATQPTPDQPVSEKSIQGTWELESFYNYDDGINVTDTIIKANGYRQIKMYFNGYIMWTRFVPDEPEGRFGYGTYKITDNELIETIEYGDAQMMKSLDTMRVFKFELKLKDKVYSQINLDEEGQRTFSENYRKID